MSDDSSLDLQQLIDRFQPDDLQVRRELMERAMGRLRRLAAKMLGQSFARLKAQHELDSVVNETWMRLAQALEQTELNSVAEFFRLAAHKIRQVLLDMVTRQQRWNREQAVDFQGGDSSANNDPSQQTSNPDQLAVWTEFHERVATLNDDQRKVFEMHYYLEIPQAQIAELLAVHPRQVSRLWIMATDRLTEGLQLADGALG
ncbi:MAG: sigma-70 family RNA polymerase sigma factor [Planctomycetia bacterium]|nr:sigma-70 family RNA polymerase sigma factor [Planctomycetia bacterium]